MNLITLPYYRFFRQNTLLPIFAIAKAARLQKNNVELATMLSSWRDRKLHELYFVQVAGTLLSAAVIGCFSWEARDFEHWVGPAARYCSLVLSLFAILLSASQSFIFTTLAQRRSRSNQYLELHPSTCDIAMICRVIRNGHPPSPPKASARVRGSFFLNESESEADDDREKGEKGGNEGKQPGLGESSSLAANHTSQDVKVYIRWNMVFTWQAPMMLLAYSVIAFLIGLTVYVCTPMYSEDLRGQEAAIFYLASLGVGGLCFIWCSFWAYIFVDLDEP